MMTTLSARRIDVAIFDMDGVVTDTARIHAAAWKKLFDEFLREREGSGFEPFTVERDYIQYVDGKPRYEGVRAFLASRGIELPFGEPSDPPGMNTVCALGNRKNALFLEQLAHEGAAVFEDTLDLIGRLKAAGIGTALVTASKNCAEILQSAGLTGLFDAQVDGNDAERLGLNGKPAPDTFLLAAQRAEALPRFCAVFEDSLAGVEAGKAGGFAMVIGVTRRNGAEEFQRHGAHVVVSDLREVRVEPLQSALDQVETIAAMLEASPHVVCLDYDGTLTPIVARPGDALLSVDMRDTIAKLAAICPVAVVTGRELGNIHALVDVDLIYAANHGFELQFPGHSPEPYEPAEGFRSEIADVAKAAKECTRGIEGVLIEHKPYSVTIHYRLVAEKDLPRVRAIAEALEREHPGLRVLKGKKVFEFQPKLDWNKGKAVLRLAERLGVPARGILYIGDDTTDEDAFRAIRGEGIGIVVWDAPRRTAADYFLAGTPEVREFLEALTALLNRDGYE